MAYCKIKNIRVIKRCVKICYNVLKSPKQTVQYTSQNLTVHISFFYADGNIFGGSVHTIKKNTDTVIVASKDIGLKINDDKTKYVVMSRDKNVRRIQNIQIDNKSLERVEQL